MAMAKNMHGYDVLVDFGNGLQSVKDGELVKVPDEYFRNHVIPPTWEVRGKPDFAALSVEEEQAQEAEKAAAESEVVDDAEARAAADKQAADDLAAAWDSADEGTSEAPAAEGEQV